MTRTRRDTLPCAVAVLLCTALSMLSFAAAVEGQVEEGLGRAPDEELLVMLESVRAEDANKARNALLDRAFRYANEQREDDAKRLIQLVMREVENTPLDEFLRLSLLNVIDVFARPYEKTADAVVESVGRLLTDDPSVLVRDKVVLMLSQSGRPAAIPFLKAGILDERNAFKETSEKSVQQAALEALEGLGRTLPEAAETLKELRSREEVTRVRMDETIKARAQTGDPNALPDLLNLIETGDNVTMRSVLVGIGLGFHKYPEKARSAIMEVLVAGLRHPNGARRQATCIAIKYVGDYHLIPLIEPLLNDPVIRRCAESAINRLQWELTQYRRNEGIPDDEGQMSIDDVIEAM